MLRENRNILEPIILITLQKLLGKKLEKEAERQRERQRDRERLKLKSSRYFFNI